MADVIAMSGRWNDHFVYATNVADVIAWVA